MAPPHPLETAEGATLDRVNNLNESMYHLREIYVSILTTEKNPNNFDKSKNLSKIQSDGFSDHK